MIKTKQDNHVTDRIGLAYVETETKLSELMESGVVYDKNQIG